MLQVGGCCYVTGRLVLLCHKYVGVIGVLTYGCHFGDMCVTCS